MARRWTDWLTTWRSSPSDSSDPDRRKRALEPARHATTETAPETDRHRPRRPRRSEDRAIAQWEELGDRVERAVQAATDAHFAEADTD